MRAALPALATVVVIAAAALLWHHLPKPTDVYGPFDVRAELGQPVSGRAVSATVTGLRIGPRLIRPPATALRPAGVWALVDTRLTATHNFERPRAQLLVGPNTYAPSDQFLAIALGTELAPGIEQRGSWVFDVPPALLDTVPSVVLRVWVGDGRLDSRLVIDIPLDDNRVTRDAVVILTPTKESAT